MVLLESDKRGMELTLVYSEDGETFTIPENVYLIGTMNTADRSLAMVDYALRRRFFFIDLPPAFSSEVGQRKFADFLRKTTVPETLIQRIIDRFKRLNAKISEDTKNLGPGFRIGHSYFCTATPDDSGGSWYRRIVDYEIAPLLREYWFDDEKKATEIIDNLDLPE